MTNKNSILFGNGINLLTPTNTSWSKLLDKLKGPVVFDNTGLPYTMTYERILMGRPIGDKHIFQEEGEIKKQIAYSMNEMHRHDIYKELSHLKMHNYITTNYDYAFRNTLHLDYELPFENMGTEDVYSVRRRVLIKTKANSDLFNIWHIHGEIDKPTTIMLGLDHYCGAIGKIDNYLKGTYEYIVDGEKIRLLSIKDKLNKNSFDNISWVELFFTTNIHILGLSLDFSEIDLWWVINKRARMLKDTNISSKIKNKIYFYCHQIDLPKKELLESFNIIVETIPLNGKPTEWLDNYRKTISRIRINL